MGGEETTHATRQSGPELTVVMPVYNEGGTIARVVRSWMGELDRLHISYEFLAYDDGSRDETADVLKLLAQTNPRLAVKSHANIGHGPTILAGYHEAVGEWVFQVDSDDEMTPDSFEQLWSCRADHDLLLGCRKDRQSPLGRRIISAGSRAIVSALFGAGVWDVNTPYRLIRRSALRGMLPSIPPTTFAPNVIMAGLAMKDRLRIRQIWVPHQPRRVGTGSIVGARQWKAAIRCAVETAAVAVRMRGSSNRSVPLKHAD